MSTREVFFASLLSMFAAAPPALAGEQSSIGDAEVRRDLILQAGDTVCRETIDEQATATSDDPRDVFASKVNDPDTLCSCTTRRMRSALASGKIDAFDRPSVADHYKNSLNACVLDGFIDHFQSFCDAIFTRFYGDDILTGAYGADVSRFCGCAKARLHRLRPETMLDAMKSAAADLEQYRDTGGIEDRGDGSMASIFAGCGIVDLKRRLIESKASDASSSTSP